MQHLWLIVRWCISGTMLINAWFFLRTAIGFLYDVKKNPKEYAESTGGKLNGIQIFSAFAISGIVCIIVMLWALPI